MPLDRLPCTHSLPLGTRRASVRMTSLHWPGLALQASASSGPSVGTFWGCGPCVLRPLEVTDCHP